MYSNESSPVVVVPTARISRITPKVPRDELFSHKRCYLGISIGNLNFENIYLESQLSWIQRHFDEALLVIGDYIYRYNEQIFHGKVGNRATSEALRKGDICAENLSPSLNCKRDCIFTVVKWKTLLETAEYREAKQALNNIYLSNPAFMDSIEKTAIAFILRQVKCRKKLAVSYDDAISLSCEYLIEEIAVFSALAELGWMVDVYPGRELPVLVDIAEGKFTSVPASLRKRINVQLDIRMIGSAI